MREKSIYEKCVERDGKICGICKLSIEEDLARYEEYLRVSDDIKKEKRRLQQRVKQLRERTVSINIDHIHPHSKGGKNHIDNYQVTHMECNTRKGNNES